MKRKLCLIIALVAATVLLFTGCDLYDFGIKNLYETYLILDTDENIEKVSCRSEKLKMPNLEECKIVTKKERIDYLKQYVSVGDDSVVFYVPAYSILDEYKNIQIYFETKIGEDLYDSVQ